MVQERAHDVPVYLEELVTVNGSSGKQSHFLQHCSHWCVAHALVNNVPLVFVQLTLNNAVGPGKRPERHGSMRETCPEESVQREWGQKWE